MASIYRCRECETHLNLNTSHLYPENFYFAAGNKGTISFSMIDHTKFKLEKENKFLPFFETVDYWGLHRNRTKIKCNSCGILLGYIYDDGPPAVDTPGQFHMGPSQVIPRFPRYSWQKCLLKIKPTKVEKKSVEAMTKLAVPPPPPSPLPLEKFWMLKPTTEIITKQEIARFCRQKCIDEENRLLAAIKAAAHIRARNLLEEDCKQFEESSKDEDF